MKALLSNYHTDGFPKISLSGLRPCSETELEENKTRHRTANMMPIPPYVDVPERLVYAHVQYDLQKKFTSLVQGLPHLGDTGRVDIYSLTDERWDQIVALIDEHKEAELNAAKEHAEKVAAAEAARLTELRKNPLYVTPDRENFAAGVAAAKKIGGKFDAHLKVWRLPVGKIDFETDSELQSKLNAINLHLADLRNCWECGCIMTYSLCKSGEGDWRDSYCGC